MGFNSADLEIGAQYTRPELAELWGYDSHAAISRGVVTPKGGGHILLFVTREKQQSLTQYVDFINGDLLHWEGERAHGNDERIARSPQTGEEIHLFYRDIHHTPFKYYGRILLTRFARKINEPSKFNFQLIHDLGPADDIATHSHELDESGPTHREALVKARIGQGQFREDLLRFWEGCAITDVRRPELLRASHIKPWRSSTNEERLDSHNGLLLLPHYDHLFDRGYITFDDRGTHILSPAIVKLPPQRLGIDPTARLRLISASHLPFLEYHSSKVFVGRTAAS